MHRYQEPLSPGVGLCVVYFQSHRQLSLARSYFKEASPENVWIVRTTHIKRGRGRLWVGSGKNPPGSKTSKVDSGQLVFISFVTFMSQTISMLFFF